MYFFFNTLIIHAKKNVANISFKKEKKWETFSIDSPILSKDLLTSEDLSYKLFSLYTQDAFIESYRPSSFKWKLACSSTLGKLPRSNYSRYILVTELFQCFFLIFFILYGGVIYFLLFSLSLIYIVREKSLCVCF